LSITQSLGEKIVLQMALMLISCVNPAQSTKAIIVTASKQDLL
jgi:hypothetical protein